MGNKQKPGSPALETARASSELTMAAAGLDAELRRYEELAAEAQRVPLDSEKNLGRATRVVREAAESQERIGGQVAALVAAVTVARERQQATAEAVLARALVIQERVSRYEALLARFDDLGRDATAINALMQELAARKDAGAPGNAESLLATLATIDERIGSTVDSARELVKSALDDGVTDIAQRTDAIRQQMQAVRNKVRLVYKSQTPATLN